MLCKCSGKYINIYSILKITYFECSGWYIQLFVMGTDNKTKAISPDSHWNPHGDIVSNVGQYVYDS